MNGNCNSFGNNNINCSTFNFGAAKRSLKNPNADRLRNQIENLPKDKDYSLVVLPGDAEAENLAQEIRGYLIATGHHVPNEVIDGIFTPKYGITMDANRTTLFVGAAQ